MESEEKELLLINQWQYDLFNIRGVDIYISQDRSNIKITLEQIGNILEKIPPEHTKLIPKIYLVNYSCPENLSTKGKHLAKLSYVILYPGAYVELEMVLTHEIGHVIWDRKLNPLERVGFYSILAREVPVTLEINNKVDRHIFVLENFANCYQFFICGTFDSKKYPQLHRFILSLF